MRNALIAAAVLALVGVTTRAAFHQTERVSRTVSLDPGGTLRLENFSGRVTITGSDRSDVVVDAVRRADRDELDRITLDVHKDGDTVVVDANHRERTSWYRRNNNVVETDFDIKVPRRTNLDVEVFSAPVTVTGVEGSYKVHTFSSRVRLNDVIWRNRQTIDVDTFSGDIEVQLPAGAAGSVTFNSFSGRLSSDVPLTLHGSSRRSFTAELGNGGDSRLRFKTFSGSVRIR
jgi:predicted ribosomally synthesized peptide with SipW-like signal peptide